MAGVEGRGRESSCCKTTSGLEGNRPDFVHAFRIISSVNA